jgi:hypothetical protein
LRKAAYENEMSNVSIAFEILKDGEPAPSNYKKSSGHWKARWMFRIHIYRFLPLRSTTLYEAHFM